MDGDLLFVVHVVQGNEAASELVCKSREQRGVVVQAEDEQLVPGFCVVYFEASHFNQVLNCIRLAIEVARFDRQLQRGLSR